MIAFVVHNHSLSDWLTKRRAVCQTNRSKTTNFHDVRLIFPRYAGLYIFTSTIMVKSLGTLSFLGCFPIRIGPTPPFNPLPSSPPPPPNNVGLVYPIFFLRVSIFYRVGEGELRENFEKDALFYEGTHKLQEIINTAVLLRLNNVFFFFQGNKAKRN